MRKKLDYSKITRMDSSFLSSYMSGFANVETPESYDFWCGAWLMSNIIGRTITVARPLAPVYLNLYAIICAESGITRKSSAVRNATAMLRLYGEEQHDFIVNTGGLTLESLDIAMNKLTALWGHTHVALSSSELVSLLGRERYVSGLPAKLTDLYDCPDIYTRSSVTRGESIARNVYVTLLAASTPSWLVRAVNPDVVEGGFTSRCLFIIEEKPKRLVAWPEEMFDAGHDTGVLRSMHKLRQDAEYAAKRAGGIRLSRVARQQFTEWYEGRKISNDAYGSSFQAREDHHILRLAGLLSASDGSWEIDEHHIEHATDVIAGIRQSGSVLFGTGIAASRTYALVDRVRGTLVAAGRTGMSQGALSAICRKQGTSDELRDILNVMHEMNLVQKFIIESGERGRPSTMFRATKSMASTKVLEDVVDMLVPQEV